MLSLFEPHVAPMCVARARAFATENNEEPRKPMNRTSILILSLAMIAFSQIGSSQQITTPTMMLHASGEIEARTMDDGRIVQRISASTVGLITVEWPKGTSTTAHNHANELVLHVLEGRLRAFGGGQEFVMEAGDTVVIPAWVDHRYEALEDSVTVEAAGPG